MNKRGFLLIIGLLFLFNMGSVFGQGVLSDFFDIVKDELDLVSLYTRYPAAIESLVYLIIFVSLGVHIATRQGSSWNTKQGKTLFVTIGVALAIMTTIGFRKWGITFEAMGTYLGLIVLLAFAYGIFALFREFGGDKPGAGRTLVLSVGFLLTYFIVNTLSHGAVQKFFEASKFTSTVLRLALTGFSVAAVISLFMVLARMFKFGSTNDTLSPKAAQRWENAGEGLGKFVGKLLGRGKRREPTVIEKPDERFYVRYGSGADPVSNKDLREDSHKIMKSIELEMLDEKQLHDYVLESISRIGKELVVEENALSELKKRGKEKDASEAIIGIVGNIGKETGKIMSVMISDLNNHKKNMKKMNEATEKIFPSFSGRHKEQILAAFDEYSGRIKKYWQFCVEDSNPVLDGFVKLLEQQKHNARVVGASPDDADSVESIIKEMQDSLILQKQALLKIKANFEKYKLFEINKFAKYVATDIIGQFPKAIAETKIAKLGNFHFLGDRNHPATILQIADYLARDASNTLFQTHVGDDHNHFATWIAPVDKEFAEHISKIKGKAELMDAFAKYVRNSCQYPY